MRLTGQILKLSDDVGLLVTPREPVQEKVEDGLVTYTLTFDCFPVRRRGDGWERMDPEVPPQGDPPPPPRDPGKATS